MERGFFIRSGLFHFSVKIEKMKRKTTMYIDDAILRNVRVAAARAGQHDYEVVEQALRAYLGMDFLQKLSIKNPPGEKEALRIAYQELHRSRKK